MHENLGNVHDVKIFVLPVLFALYGCGECKTSSSCSTACPQHSRQGYCMSCTFHHLGAGTPPLHWHSRGRSSWADTGLYTLGSPEALDYIIGYRSRMSWKHKLLHCLLLGILYLQYPTKAVISLFITDRKAPGCRRIRLHHKKRCTHPVHTTSYLFPALDYTLFLSEKKMRTAGSYNWICRGLWTALTLSRGEMARLPYSSPCCTPGDNYPHRSWWGRGREPSHTAPLEDDRWCQEDSHHCSHCRQTGRLPCHSPPHTMSSQGRELLHMETSCCLKNRLQ